MPITVPRFCYYASVVHYSISERGWIDESVNCCTSEESYIKTLIKLGRVYVADPMAYPNNCCFFTN